MRSSKNWPIVEVTNEHPIAWSRHVRKARFFVARGPFTQRVSCEAIRCFACLTVTQVNVCRNDS